MTSKMNKAKPMADIKEVGENIYLIDNDLYTVPGLGAVYLVNEEKKALIDIGPSTSVKAVLSGLQQAGVAPEEIDYIIITHVHLDHGGGAGLALQYLPRAKVIVHHKGVWHMANPARLVRGMREAQGEAYVRKCGETIPVPPERIQAVGEGDTLELSRQQVLKFMDAPGHAPHQIAILETRNGGVFTGEAAGSLMGDGKILFPFVNVPFDLSQFISTLQRLMHMKPAMLYYAHFGAANSVQHNLELALKRILTWDEIATRGIKENDTDRIADKMMAECRAEIDEVRRMPVYDFIAMNIPVCAAAFRQYYQDKPAAVRQN